MGLYTAEPFSQVLNPTGRSDGYTRVLTADEPANLALVDLPIELVLRSTELIVDFEIVAASSEPGFAFRPNGLDVGTSIQRPWLTGDASPRTPSVSPNLYLGGYGEADTVLFAGRFTLQTRIGLRRRFMCHSLSYTSTTPRIERETYIHGLWPDSTTLLTSVVISRNNANSIRAGSRFKVTLKG